jgi:hypothetical protein
MPKELRVHVNPWFWLSQPNLPYWWLVQRAVVAGLLTCGLAPLEIKDIRYGPLPPEEVERRHVGTVKGVRDKLHQDCLGARNIDWHAFTYERRLSWRHAP